MNFTKLERKPKSGVNGNLYLLGTEIELYNKQCTRYVLTSYGLEILLGDLNFAVFGCDENGLVLDWHAIYSDGMGPDWCSEILNRENS